MKVLILEILGQNCSRYLFKINVVFKRIIYISLLVLLSTWVAGKIMAYIEEMWSGADRDLCEAKAK